MVLADENDEPSSVTITENEQCVLQNEVRMSAEILSLVVCGLVYSTFAWNWMIKETF